MHNSILYGYAARVDLMKINIMQKIIQIALVTCTSLVLFQGCKREKIEENSSTEEIVSSEDLSRIQLTEEFVNMESLANKQWMKFNNSIDASDCNWKQGFYKEVSSGNFLGFKAYSTGSGDDGEYAFAGQNHFLLMSSISSWLVTPPLELKNGDMFSFYTRCDSKIIAPHALELRLSMEEYPNAGSTPKDVGSFTQLLHTVNPHRSQDGYPSTWEKIEVKISGLATDVKGRIAFRFMSEGQVNGGIGIDQFVYTSK